MENKIKSPCYGCKYKEQCGAPREGHPCNGREKKGRNKKMKGEAKNNEREMLQNLQV